MFDLRPVDDGLLGSGSPLLSLYPTKSTRFPLAPGTSSACHLPFIADTDHDVEFVYPVVKSPLRSTALLGEPSMPARVALEARDVFGATPESAEAEAAAEEDAGDVWAEALEPGPAPVGLLASRPSRGSLNASSSYRLLGSSRGTRYVHPSISDTNHHYSVKLQLLFGKQRGEFWLDPAGSALTFRRLQTRQRLILAQSARLPSRNTHISPSHRLTWPRVRPLRLGPHRRRVCVAQGRQGEGPRRRTALGRFGTGIG